MSTHGELLKSLLEGPCFSCAHYRDCSHMRRKAFDTSMRACVELGQAKLAGAITMAQLQYAAAQRLAESQNAARSPCLKSLDDATPFRCLAQFAQAPAA